MTTQEIKDTIAQKEREIEILRKEVPSDGEALDNDGE